MSVNINEQVLEAISIVAKNYISSLGYDQTVEAEITKIVNIDTGEYKVLYNGNTMSAFSLDKKTVYDIGDTVYMKISENDLSKERTILSKRDKKSLTAEEITALENQFQPVGPVWTAPALSTKSTTSGFFEFDELFSDFTNNYEYILIKANFKTYLLNERTGGRYGLRFTFYTNEEDKTLVYELDSKSFIGKPFEFFEPAPQSLFLDIKKGVLKPSVKVEFYTEFNDKEELNYGEIKNEYIEVKDISLTFCDKLDLQDNSYFVNIIQPSGVKFLNDEEQKKYSVELIYGKQIKIPEEDLKIKWYKLADLGWQELEGRELTVLGSQVGFNTKFKAVIEYNENIKLEKELELFNESIKIDTIELKQINENEKMYLILDVVGEEELEYLWLVNGDKHTGQKIDITSYLGYEAIEVYAEAQLKTGGEASGRTIYSTNHTIINSDSSSDLLVYFKGTDEHLYDEKGEISFVQHEINHTITPILQWNNGKGGYIKSISWYLNGYDLSTTPYPSGSMLENIWVDQNNCLNYNAAQTYEQDKNNNTLELRVETLGGNIFKYEKPIKFTKLGNKDITSTSYKLVIRPYDEDTKEMIKGYSNSKSLKAFLYQGGKLVEEESYEVQWSDGIMGPGTTKAKVLTNDGYYLYAYYGVNENLTEIYNELVNVSNLPKEIKFDSNGLNPQYTTSQLTPSYNNELLNVTILDNDYFTIEDNYLKPKGKYTGGNSFITLELARPNGTKIIRWPISLIIDTTGKEALQGWDGNQLIVDEGEADSDIITTPQAGAGTMSEDGKFSGVVLGELTETGESAAANAQGLYGYSNGQKTFGLTANGDAYFGANKEISISAENAVISSNKGTYGMKIDLSANAETEKAIVVSGSSEFTVDYSGAMIANAGTIGGWKITDKELHDDDRITILDADNGIITNTLKIVNENEKITDEDGNEYYETLGSLGKITGQTTNEGQVSSTICLGLDTKETGISIVLESGANVRISVPEKGSFYLNCAAENQHGIYARFA